MNALARAWVITLIMSAVVTVLAALLARVWRRDDVESWHGVYAAIAAASLTVPLVACGLPTVRVVWHSWVAIAVPAAPVDLPADWWSWIGAIYVFGVALSALHLLLGVSVVRHLRRTARVPHGLWAQRLGALEGIDVTRCRWHPRVQSPMTLGVFDSLVILPATAIFWSNPRLQAVLQHELAHIRRRDYFWNLIAACHRIVYWPSPTAWWLVRRARLASELECDRQASTIVGDARYAQILVQSAREFVGAGRRLLAPGAETDLFARLEALLRMNGARRRVMTRGARLLLVGAVLMILFAAPVVRFATVAPGERPLGSDHLLKHVLRHAGH